MAERAEPGPSFDALMRLTELIARAPDPRVLGEAALDAALRPLGLDRGAFFLTQAGGGELVIETSRGLPPPVRGRRGRQAVAAVGTGLAGACAHARRPFVVEDLAHEAAAKELVAAFREAGVEVRSAAAVPVEGRDRALGALLAVSEPRRAFSPAEVAHLRLVGLLTGAALASQATEREVATTNEQLKALTTALEQRTAELKELDKYKARSIHMITHELRKPLAPIFTYSDMLLGLDFPPEKQREFLKTIRAAADEMNQYVTEMINLANLEQGGIQLLFSDVNIAEVVRFAVAKWADEAATSRVTVTIENALKKSTYTTDGVKIGEIVENLLENGIKYTPEGGRVTVRLSSAKDGAVEIAVEDTGIGIPPEEIPNLFQKFSIVKRAEVPRPTHRAGLGLYLARVYAEAMGGNLRVVSEVGKGSTFTLRLPMAG